MSNTFSKANLLAIRISLFCLFLVFCMLAVTSAQSEKDGTQARVLQIEHARMHLKPSAVLRTIYTK